VSRKKIEIENGVDYTASRTHTFTIIGNYKDPEGNPIPYQRLTQMTKRYARGEKYATWKAYVAKSFIDSLDWSEQNAHEQNIAFTEKPIVLENHETARVEIEICFKGQAHGDPDNVLKGIIDALFADDKYCDGATSSTFGTRQGLVIVKITTYEYEHWK